MTWNVFSILRFRCTTYDLMSNRCYWYGLTCIPFPWLQWWPAAESILLHRPPAGTGVDDPWWTHRRSRPPSPRKVSVLHVLHVQHVHALSYADTLYDTRTVGGLMWLEIKVADPGGLGCLTPPPGFFCLFVSIWKFLPTWTLTPPPLEEFQPRTPPRRIPRSAPEIYKGKWN